MSRRKFKFFSYSKMIAPAVAAVGIVTLSTMNACSPSDRSTAAREEVIAQNALDAERAEEQMTKEGDKPAVVAPAAGKHDAKADKAHAKADKKADKAHATAAVPKQPKLKPDHVVDHAPVKTAKADSMHANETAPAAHLAQKELSGSPVAAHDAGHATPSTARKPASIGGGSYVVQVGAFKVKENAEKLQAKLKEAGYKVETQTVEHSKNGLLHLVRFEATTNRAEAETMVEDLHAKHELSAQILTH
jgi:cell division septation protein DedD